MFGVSGDGNGISEYVEYVVRYLIIISLSTGHFLTAPQLSKKLIDEVLHCAGDNQFFTPTQSEAPRLFPQFENCNINQCDVIWAK